MIVRAFRTFPMEAMQIRKIVFVDEQGFIDEFDETDKVAVHIVAYDDDTPIGTCRVFYDDQKTVHVLGRLAVKKEYRNKSIGSLLLTEAEKTVSKDGGKELILHSQLAAREFYEKNGYSCFGQVEDEQGCPHIWMMKKVGGVHESVNP